MERPRPDPLAVLAEAAHVRRLARALVLDRSGAGDVAQEALLLALERAPRDPGKLAGWLAALVRNVARKGWRADARRDRREREAARPEGTVPGPDEILEREDLRRALVERVLALEPPLREVLVLRHFEELPPRAIARRLGLPVETVRTRIKRAHELLRARLDRESGGDRAAWSLALLGGVARPRSAAELGAVLAGAAVHGGIVMGMVKTAALAAGCVGLVALGVMRLGSERTREEPTEASAVAEVELVAGAPVELEGAKATEPARMEASSPEAPPAPSNEPMASGEPTTGALLLLVTWHDGTPAEDVGATLYLPGAEDLRADAFEVRTASDGTFLVEDVAPGRAFAFLDRGAVGVTEVVAGGLAELAVELPRGYDVLGRVVEVDGAPVPDAEILLSTNGGAPTSFHRVARSDAEGRFEIRSVDGLGWLAARASRRAPSAAYTVMSGAGATLEVQLTMQGGGGAVEGDVRDAAGQPVGGAQLVIGAEFAFDGVTVPEGGQAHRLPGVFVTSDTDGRFASDGLVPGVQPVVVRARGLAPWRGAVEVVERGTASLAITLLAEARVAGVVTDASGTPAGGVEVRTHDEGFLGRVTRTDADGSYSLRGLPAGEIELVADAEARGRARTTLTGVAGAIVAWSPVLEGGRSLRGRIELAGDVTQLAVRCWRRDDGEAPFVLDVRPDEHGAFELTGLADAAHRVEVFVRGSSYAFPIAIRKDVRPGPEELVIALDPAELPSVRLVGRIVDARGEGRPGMMVTPVWESNVDVHNSPLVTTDELGGFDLGPYPPGRWSVRVRVGGGSVRLDPVELAPHESFDFGEIVLD